MELKIGIDGKKRCFGNKDGEILYAKYHDLEWGIPEHNDQKLFEMLILEGAQAGLSWYCILKKRDAYRRAFKNFDPTKVAMMSDDELELLREDKEIVRNRLKIYAARENAKIFLAIKMQFGTFDKYLWSSVNFKAIINYPQTLQDIPASTELSDKISKDLKTRGMSFVGSKIIYAYMQAVGLVNDHVLDCHLGKNKLV